MGDIKLTLEASINSLKATLAILEKQLEELRKRPIGVTYFGEDYLMGPNKMGHIKCNSCKEVKRFNGPESKPEKGKDFDGNSWTFPKPHLAHCPECSNIKIKPKENHGTR